MRTSYFGGGSGGEGGAVSSVFGRTGAVVAASGDYTDTQITNTSGVSGASVKDALDTLNSGKVPTTRTINTTAPLSGGGALSSNLTLSVSAVTNTNPGVVVAVGAANTALVSTGTAAAWSAIANSFNGRTGAVTPASGDYTSSQITNASGVAGATTSDALNTLNTGKVSTSRNINTTAPLAGGGSLSADLTLSVSAVTNAASGVVVAVGASGTFLISTGTAAAWGTDVGSQTITTTGGFASNTGGAGQVATAGSIRLPNGNFVGVINARNNANTADVFLLGYSSTSSTLQLGSNSSGNPSLSTCDIAALTTVRVRITSSGTVIFQATSTQISIGSTVSSFSFDGTPTVAIQQLGATGAGKTLSIIAQSGATTGGNLQLSGGDAAAANSGGHVSMTPGKGSGNAGNINLGSAAIPGFNGMQRGIFVPNCDNPPNANPTGGSYIYGASGNGYAVSPNGSINTLWAA